MRIVDISIPLETGMFKFPRPDHVTVSISAEGTYEEVACRTSRLVLGSHSGTHVDAPMHMIEGADPIDQVPLDYVFGPAQVLRIPAGPKEVIDVDRLQDTAGSQDRDLALILAADALRDSFEETDIIGRVGPNRFAVASVESAENKSARATEALARVLAAGNLGAARPAVTVCAATASTQAGAFSSFPLLLEAAETSLCENRRSKAKA